MALHIETPLLNSRALSLHSERAIWLKLEALQKCRGEPFEMPMPPDGKTKTMPGAVAALTWLVAYHCAKIGWFDKEGDNTLTSAMMFRKEPKTGTGGTLAGARTYTGTCPAQVHAVLAQPAEDPHFGTRAADADDVRVWTARVREQVTRALDHLEA